MKPGIKTSELALIILLLVFAAANGTEYIAVPWDQFKWIAGAVMTYVVSRTAIKYVERTVETKNDA